MKHLDDFDLSIVLPLCIPPEECRLLSLDMLPYYERNGIEVIIIAMASHLGRKVTDYICNYPFINWKVVINSTDNNLWENPVQALNTGILQSEKRFVLFFEADMTIQTDVIYELREKLEYYTGHYAITQTNPTGCIMVRKEDLLKIGGYSEQHATWREEQRDLCIRLEFMGIHRLCLPDSIVLQKNGLQTDTYGRGPLPLPKQILAQMLLPTELKMGDIQNVYSSTVLYDWRNRQISFRQCRNYLTSFKDYEILSDDIFEKSYSLIALIPTYNESSRIKDCIRSVERHCDGIILLDDDSKDGTFQMAYSDKMLLKVRKERKEFNDRQNRNILLDLASFFKSDWFIFIDADERFDDRLMDLRKNMKRKDVDVIGLWIANLWDSTETYRTDMEDSNPHSKNGLWFRWRMFRNKGRMQFHIGRTLHFSSVPYRKDKYSLISKTLLLHLGYLEENKRKEKYNFYQKEDRHQIISYEPILHKNIKLLNVCDISEKDL